MVHTITIPRLNANEDEVLIADIMVSEGDFVSAGDELFMIESAKATDEVLAVADGYVRGLRAERGQTVAVGTAICVLSQSREDPLPQEAVQASETTTAGRPAVGMPGKTAKQRLLLKRAGKSSRATETGKPGSPPPIPDVASADTPWVQAMRAALDRHCGTDNRQPHKTFAAERLAQGSLDGVFVDEGVSLAEGARIIARRLYIGRNVSVGKNTVLKADTIYLGSEAKIWGNVSLTSDEILIDDGVLIAGGTCADLSGGRTKDSRLIVGAASLIGGNVLLNTSSEVFIQRQCAVSPGAMLFTHSFWQSVLDGYHAMFSPIQVCENAWIGAGCQVLPGVTVGPGSVVVSNSTVTNHVPAECLVGGVPAKVLRSGIRKRLPDSDKLEILQSVMREFVECLILKNCRVDASPDFHTISVSRPDIVTRTIVVVGPQQEPYADIPELPIYLTMGTDIEAHDGCAVFDLDRMRFSGTEDRVTHELRNFLRRRGIRFQPYAWDSDYRKDL